MGTVVVSTSNDRLYPHLLSTLQYLLSPAIKHIGGRHIADSLVVTAVVVVINEVSDKPNITMYPFTAQVPYYCILIGAGTLDTNGGPKINAKAQVLDTRENPIPGLYGAGNCIAPFVPNYIAAGATLGNCLASGYAAGINAAIEPVK